MVSIYPAYRPYPRAAFIQVDPSRDRLQFWR
jgi:hypothetical protein